MSDIKTVVSFPREMVEKAAAEDCFLTATILPQCAQLMLRERKRIIIATGAPEPSRDEVVAYLRRYIAEPHRSDLWMDYVIHGVDIGPLIERIAALQGLEPYDVAQGMCQGVPLTDTEFHDYIEAAKREGATHVDPRAIIITTVPIPKAEEPPKPGLGDTSDPEQIKCLDATGRELLAYVVDDGGRHWVWAYDEDDAIRVVAETHCGSVERYEADIGPLTDAEVTPLTKEAARLARFHDEDGMTMSMAAHFAREQKRGLMATTEF